MLLRSETVDAKARVWRRRRKHMRVRRKVFGTAERPRLCVFRSHRYIYAQIIDDLRGHTLAAASTLERGLRNGLSSLKDTAAAQLVGKTVAERAIKKGVKKVVFDRGGYAYHGRVAELAKAAREAGLEF